MDPTLQRHCARYIYIVPDGLRELMSDISREVLRNQPDDIYTFIADYLDALLITRENARVAAQFVQSLTDAVETIVDLLETTGISREKADEAADVIQEAFRNWSGRKGILKEDEDIVITKILENFNINEFEAQDAAVAIQHAYRAFKVRQQREQELRQGIIDWRVAARSTIKLYRRTGVSVEEAKRAANLIKAAYKGYYTRRAMKKLNESNESFPEEHYEESSSLSYTSSFTDKKGVRIDYDTVLPHVAFGDADTISKDETIDDVEQEERRVSDEKPKAEEIQRVPSKTSSEKFVRGLLEQYLSTIGEEQTEYHGESEVEIILENYHIDEEHAQKAALTIQHAYSVYKVKQKSKQELIEKQETQTEAATEGPTEAKIEETTEAKTEETTEAKIEETTEAKTEETTETKTEETIEAKTEVVTEAITEETIEVKTEETTEAKTEAVTEAKTEETNEAETEGLTEAKMEETTEAKIEETIEAKTEETIEAKTEEITEATTEEPTEAKTEGIDEATRDEN